ncbi:HTH-type transcriptional regulator RegA [Saliniradius amylolyticus]|uniref:HTH-type transcriptional regulator RegA n=1 Tax=Saliniradius amylolyticus TaxID=2183582 RepID=A0A2S2E4P4_9ALTE|nr:LacI family DNA-binding transcriptional regulator [Saliniradius amylolyticus]AWL11967.1 HTH-type transcriptional regulator RegA [Saliniradius amylolyticus]
MKATIKDVAHEAGVSIKTVSRVINKENSVKDETVKRVTQAIEKLGYEPNKAARNLAGTRSYTIGYVYDNPNAYYVIGMQNGILDECREQGYELVIHPCDASAANICDELGAMVRKSQLAGLVISPPLSEMPHVLERLTEMAIPFVRIISGSFESKENYASIYVHDHEAAYNITQHLACQGHSRIAFISGDKDHRSTTERLNGYKAALSDNDIRFQPGYVYEGRYSFETGVQGAKQLLQLDNPPSAIFACNDEIAAGALFAARLLGVDVPVQLAIAGFEDSPFSRQTWPKLTTAAQPTNDIAREAASMLVNNIAAQRGTRAKDTRIGHFHFEPQLVIRESTQQPYEQT